MIYFNYIKNNKHQINVAIKNKVVTKISYEIKALLVLSYSENETCGCNVPTKQVLEQVYLITTLREEVNK